ncbi:MAG: hypothetical protein COB04_12880 [Gammaproteobacteria bacterium]|nr:MAG: hypothetical protein COB04_12880 [Gammaproteobacteria bacterium]
MNVMIDLCIVPIGEGTSLSPYIAQCTRILRSSGLKTTLHPFGTIVEGEWDAVFAAVKQCHSYLHVAMDVVRINTTIKVGTRTDKAQTGEEKVASVERLLKK